MGRGLLADVDAAIRRRALLADGDSVLVAVSGGADSVALVTALAELRRARWRLVVAHVRHGLRGPASEEDARFVARLAAELGLPHVDLDGRIEHGPALEDRARRRRYDELLAAARRLGCGRIAVGHTRDDRAETLLHRLVRGSGRHGLGSIRWSRAHGVVRPLLGTARDEVLTFLRERGLSWREDASNADPRHTRNRIRHVLLPALERELGPGARAALGRVAEILADEDEWLEGESRSRLADAGRGTALDAPMLASLAPAVARRVVRLWIAERRGDLLEIGFDHVERIRELARDGGSRRASVPGGTVRRRGGELRWGAAERRLAGRPVPLAPGRSTTFGDFRFTIIEGSGARADPGPWRAVFDRARVDLARLAVRAARPGDRLRPLGLGGTKKLQDVFVDAKLPREERSRHPVVTCGGTIVWVPGLARAELAAVAADTRETLVVRCVRTIGEEAHRVAAPQTLCYGPTGEKSPRGVRSGRSRLESAPTKEAD